MIMETDSILQHEPPAVSKPGTWQMSVGLLRDRLCPIRSLQQTRRSSIQECCSLCRTITLYSCLTSACHTASCMQTYENGPRNLARSAKRVFVRKCVQVDAQAEHARSSTADGLTWSVELDSGARHLTGALYTHRWLIQLRGCHLTQA